MPGACGRGCQHVDGIRRSRSSNSSEWIWRMRLAACTGVEVGGVEEERRVELTREAGL